MGNKTTRDDFKKEKFCVNQLSPLNFTPNSTKMQTLKALQPIQMEVNRQGILINLLAISFLMASVNSVIVPFYPQLASIRGVQQTLIGFVFAIAYLGSFLSSLLFGKLLHLIGRKKLILIGLILQAVSVILFGLLEYIKDKIWFIIYSIIIRLVMGVSYAAFQSVAYAYIPLIFSDQIEKKMGQMETAFGIGQLMGPVIGSALYVLGGYQCPFLVIAAVFIIAITLFIKFLPADNLIQQNISSNKIKNKINENNNNIQNEQQEEQESKDSLSISRFIKHKDFMLTVLVPVFGFLGLGTVMSTIAVELELSYGFSTAINGLLYTQSTLSYFITMPIYNILPKTIDRKKYLCIGILINSISIYLIAPQKQLMHWLGLVNRQQLPFTCLGLLGTGAGTAFIYIPLLPTLIKYGQQVYTSTNQHTKVNDMSVGFMNSAVNFALFFSPILSGILVQIYDYNITYDCMGIVMILYLLIYMIFCSGGCAEIQTKQTNKKSKPIDKDLNDDKYELLIDNNECNISLNRIQQQ